FDAIGVGAASMVWQTEGFATADAYDEATGRYLGLTVGEIATPTASTLVVVPDRAAAQLESDQAAAAQTGPGDAATVSTLGGDSVASVVTGTQTAPTGPTTPTRFHAAVELDAERLNRDFGKVSAEVISHLTSLLGTDVTITVEIAATNQDGFPDTTVRNV